MPDYRLRIAINSTPSGATEVNFGVKTRSGHGGWPTAETAGSAITGVGASDWVIDARGHLVPSGTYGAAKSFSRSSYSLTLASGALYAITMVANAAHAREMTPVSLGGGASVNADSLGTQRVSQFHTLLEAATNIAGGDTIWCRSGHFNPTSLACNIRVPAASGGSWTASATRVTIRSEVVDATIDSEGHRNRQHGFRVGAFFVSGQTSGDIFIPLDIRDLYALCTNAGFAGGLIKYSNSSGFGVRCYNSRFEATSNPSGTIDGFINRGGNLPGQSSALEDSIFVGIGKSSSLSSSPGRPAVGTSNKRNTYLRQFDDIIGIGLTNAPSATGVASVQIEDEFCYGGTPVAGSHPDFGQHQGVRDGTLVEFGYFIRSILVQGAEASFQFLFNDDSTGLSRLINAVFKNNIGTTNRSQGIWLNRFNNPDVRFNTVLRHLGPGTIPSVKISPADAGGDGGVFTHNVVVALELGPQTGTVISTPNAILAMTLDAYRVAFPNYSQGTELRSKRVTLRAFTPANTLVANGGVMNPDGTCNGALFPLTNLDDNNGAWNDGSVFAPDDPVWRAAHPMAA